MWFAALSSYQNNPWFVSLLDRLLNLTPTAVELLDETVESMSGIEAIRAKLYDYDFTRTESEWTETLPGAEVVQADEGGADWWYRRGGREYVPEVEKGNESVGAFLRSHGIPPACDEESRAEEGGNLTWWLYQVHVNGGVWSPVIFVFVGAALVRMDERGWLEWAKKRSRRANRWGKERGEENEKEKEKEA